MVKVIVICLDQTKDIFLLLIKSVQVDKSSYSEQKPGGHDQFPCDPTNQGSMEVEESIAEQVKDAILPMPTPDHSLPVTNNPLPVTAIRINPPIFQFSQPFQVVNT